ncbi:MAG: hypothetical protein R2867_03220 [Caldilineaceae bacterium]
MANTHPRRGQPYEMRKQLHKGEAAEAALDRHFADRFHVVAATRKQQRQGIDRIFTQRASGQIYTMEYKTDWTAARTGNAFVETISVDREGIPGWVYTSHAEWLVYFVPANFTIYLIAFADLRARLPHWLATYKPSPPIPNRGYNTHGILVPLAEFACIASRIESA